MHIHDYIICSVLSAVFIAMMFVYVHTCCVCMYIKKLYHSRSRPSLVDTQGEMMTSPPYEYPRHLTSMTRMPESELTLEPATASTVL